MISTKIDGDNFTDHPLIDEDKIHHLKTQQWSYLIYSKGCSLVKIQYVA